VEDTTYLLLPNMPKIEYQEEEEEEEEEEEIKCE
jgi:hypothetical protein